MFGPGMYEEYLNDKYDSYVERMKEILSKRIHTDEDIEELKELMEYIEVDYGRRY